MEQLQPDRRPCAHCGGVVATDDTTCATCGQPYIPDTGDRTSRDGGPPGSSNRPDAAATPSAAAPGTISDESRAWAIGAHLSALAGVLLGGLPAFLGPLVVWLLRRDARDPFATQHARNALNFNLSVIIYAIVVAVVGVVVSIVTLGLGLLVVVPAVVVAFIAYVVVTVRAAMAAAQREPYRYPLALELVR